MKPILHTAAGNQENQDRGLVMYDGPRVLLCVADGAGGLSGGTQAAVMAIEFVRRNFLAANNAESCADLLRHRDITIAKDSVAGETTCVLGVVTPEEIFGASVGDSGIWLISKNVSTSTLLVRNNANRYSVRAAPGLSPFGTCRSEDSFSWPVTDYSNTRLQNVSLKLSDNDQAKPQHRP